MTSQSVIVLVVGLLLGIILGGLAAWLVLRARAQVIDAAAASAQSDLRADAAAARNEAAQARAEMASARAAVADARADAERARAEAARLGTDDARREASVSEAQTMAALAAAEAAEVRSQLAAAKAQRDAASQRAEELARDRESLVNQFKALSAEQLERQNKQAQLTSDERLKATESLLSPVRQGLDLMNARLTEVEKERAALAAELRQQVQSVVTTGDNLRRETAALVTALRKPQVRGAWGETQLRRVAEITGMVERCDFDVQVSTSTDDGVKRPDMRVNLADGKVMFVDSKVPLSSFLDAFETDDESLRATHLTAFGRTVRTHVEQLSAKNYWQLDHGSPEFVVLFLPSEAFLQVAMEQNPDLQEFALRKQIVLATPSILIPLLRAVQHGWKQASLAESAAEVAQLGRDLYERLGVMGSHFDKLGRSLTGAVKNYNAAMASMETRVFVSARRFQELEVSREDLRHPELVKDSVRVITAAELVDSAAQADASLGRLPDPGEADLFTESADLERAELSRQQPSVADLVHDDANTPASIRTLRSRKLGS